MPRTPQKTFDNVGDNSGYHNEGLGWGECVVGTFWVETNDADRHTTMSKTAPQQWRIIWPKMSIVASLRNHTLIRMTNFKPQGHICNTSLVKKYFWMSIERAYKDKSNSAKSLGPDCLSTISH